MNTLQKSKHYKRSRSPSFDCGMSTNDIVTTSMANDDENDGDNDEDSDEDDDDFDENDNNDNVNNMEEKGNDDNDDKFDDFMIENIVKLNENWEEKTAQFIFDKLILCAEYRFNFGIYLSHYVVFQRKCQNNCPNAALNQISTFPNQYVECMHKYCGITWKIN